MGIRDTCRLGRHPEKLSRLWYLGHVSHSQASGGKYHSLDFTTHSGASGRVAAHSEASGEACGALGGFWGWLSASALGGTCRAPKVIPKWVSKGGLRAGLRDTWHAPK